jgi:methionine-gamma-lyase
MLTGLAARFGVQVSFISGTDPGELAAAIRPETRILYLETIANPTTEVADLPGLLGQAGQAGLIRVVDNTFATPVLCRPMDYGADIVVHSATKYLGGHDDVIAGLAIFADQAVHARVWRNAVDLGVAADPFACWLVLRGLKTLPLRLVRHCENAEKLAHLLDGHPRVSQVRWPGLPGHPSHRLATEILHGYGGILAFDLAGGLAAAREFTSRLTYALLATSLGGPQTLVLRPASSSQRELDTAARRAAGISEDTIRVSAGLEHHEDLMADFEQALKP